MTLCYPPFIGRLAFAAVDGELHSNSSGFILFFRNNRVGFGGSFYIGSVIQKRKKRRAICPQPLELPFPALHSLFVFFPVGLRKFFPPTRHTSRGICEKYHDILHFFRSNGGATLLPAPTGQDFLMRQRPNSNRQKCHTWENHPWWERWQRRSHHAFRERKFDSTRAPETGESDGRVNYRHWSMRPRSAPSEKARTQLAGLIEFGKLFQEHFFSR